MSLKEEANGYIEAQAQGFPSDERGRFSESVSRDLLSLHEGNFARYRVTQTSFHAWQSHWGLDINDNYDLT